MADELAGWLNEHLGGTLGVTGEGIINYTDSWTFLMLPQHNSLLRNLHAHALPLVDPMMDRAALDPHPALPGFSEQERAMYLKWGCVFAESTWLPHITIAKLDPEVSHEICAYTKENRIGYLPLTYDRVTVYRCGPNGAHAEVLHEARFGA